MVPAVRRTREIGRSARPMSLPEADPGSFRDPGGRVFIGGDRVLRAVMERNAPAFRAAQATELYEQLSEKRLLLPAREVPVSDLGPNGAGAVHALEHPLIPFISYPYEWSFAAHQQAALLHLDFHLEALKAGFTLTDATAYNVQFEGTRPVFIDHLSLRPYRDGELWTGHRQFCMQFLNPLLFWSALATPPNAWFRGSLEGIAPEETAALLPLRTKFSWTVFTHVVAQASLQRRALKGRHTRTGLSQSRLPRGAFEGLLLGLRHYIAGLKRPSANTVWADYASANSYSDAQAQEKLRFVQEMVTAVRPAILFDLGCNSGDYSAAALDAGAGYVVGFDYDHAALDRAFDRLRQDERRFLPLWLDAANPSPAQGWAQGERRGLRERGSADALIALAFIHHIVIGRNVPLPMALDWLLSLAPTGVIEFPPKTDPMVQRLLTLREDVFSEYDEGRFLMALGARARIVRTLHLSEEGRLLVWYDRT